MSSLSPSPSSPEAWRTVQSLVLQAWLSAFQLWDLLVCLPAEIRRLYWPEAVRWVRTGQPPSLGSIFLLNTRLLTLPIIAMSAYSLGQPHKCQTSWTAWFTLTGLAHTNSAAIFAVRTIAIRSANRLTKTSLWIGVLAVAASNLWWAQTLHLAQLPPTLIAANAPTCIVLPEQVSVALWLPDTVILAFDTAILLLTLHKALQLLRPYGFSLRGIRDYRQASTRLTRHFFLAALGWYLVSMAILVAEVAWANTHAGTDVYQGLFIPFHVWTSVTIAPRVLRGMKLYQAREQHSMPGAVANICNKCGPRSPAMFHDAPRSTSSSGSDSPRFVDDPKPLPSIAEPGAGHLSRTSSALSSSLPTTPLATHQSSMRHAMTSEVLQDRCALHPSHRIAVRDGFEVVIQLDRKGV